MTQKQLERLRDELIVEIVWSGNVPSAPAPPPKDVWGNALAYGMIPMAVCGPPAGRVAFTITSHGMDGNPGVDDVAISQTNDQLKSYIVKGGSLCP